MLNDDFYDLDRALMRWVEEEVDRVLRQLAYAATLEDASGPTWGAEPLRPRVWELAADLADGPIHCFYHLHNVRLSIFYAAIDLRSGRGITRAADSRVAWALERAVVILEGICGDNANWAPHDPDCPFCKGIWCWG